MFLMILHSFDVCVEALEIDVYDFDYTKLNHSLLNREKNAYMNYTTRIIVRV